MSTTSEPLVSVIMPTYNRPEYLREAIQSAVRQNYSNMEILVRDNASTDETRQTVLSFSDARIRYHRHPENVGPTENVIGGCREARGQYIAHLHDDDVWEPDFLEKLVPPLEQNSGAAIAFCDHYIIDAQGAIDPARTHRNTVRWKRHALRPGLHSPLQRIALLDKSIPLSMGALMRRAAIDWNDVPNLPSCYDLWLMYLICRDGQAGFYVPERLTRYRVHANSETTLGRMRGDQGYLICCEQMLEDERLADIRGELRIEYARACADLGVTLVRRGRVVEGRPCLRRSLQVRWSWRALTLYGLSFTPLLSARDARQEWSGLRREGSFSLASALALSDPLPETSREGEAPADGHGANKSNTRNPFAQTETSRPPTGAKSPNGARALTKPA
jgi:glycosyltransferase involved in cell wall biosynthesis